MGDTSHSVDNLVAENAALRSELEARVAELERSQRLLRHVLDTSPSAIYIKDLEGRFLLVNNQAAAIMGHSADDLLGKADHELFSPEFVAQWRAAEQAVLRTGRPVAQEETAPLPDGVHTFLSSRAPIVDEHGAIYAIGGVSTDITTRARAEEERRSSQDLLVTIFNHLPVAVFLKDVEGRFVLWNAACERLYGAKAAEVIGKTDYDFFPKEVAAALEARNQATLTSGKVDMTPEEVINSPHLGPVEVSITRVPILDAQGRPSHLLVICDDLTERKQAADERSALQAQVIEAQQHALRELSTPLLPLSNRVVLMPIVGAMDSRRAQQVIETLLEGVAANNAEIAIVDITGVQVVDTQVANAFIQSARAVQLLGARVMLTGIRPEVAQTLVQLGVDLQNMLTRGSLQAGIAYAFNR
jgi:rsbT co-antagonist protein RsbR